jgi:PAS domain S-box-containing protein
MAHVNGWPALFASAFRQSRNAMVLLDEHRRVVDVNPASLRLVGLRRHELIGRHVWEVIEGGPVATPEEWRDALAGKRFTGEATVMHTDGTRVGVQWGAETEVATGRRLVLFVVLNTSRWGARFRRTPDSDDQHAALSRREREVVELVARGATGPEIADELGITHDTVRTHVRNAMTKVGARSRAQLVAKAVGEGVVLA